MEFYVLFYFLSFLFLDLSERGDIALSIPCGLWRAYTVIMLVRGGLFSFLWPRNPTASGLSTEEFSSRFLSLLLLSFGQ